MDADSTLRFKRLSKEDKKQLNVILSWQIAHKDASGLICDLSLPAGEWLIDYETDLI